MNFSEQDRETYIAAGDNSIPLARLQCLVLHEDYRIRARVAENPRTPQEWLWDLASDDSPVVRIAVAENPGTPLALRETLAQNDHVDVRFAIAENANTLPHLLRILLRDENPYIADRATQTLHRVAKEQLANSPLSNIVKGIRNSQRSQSPLGQELQDSSPYKIKALG